MITPDHTGSLWILLDHNGLHRITPDHTGSLDQTGSNRITGADRIKQDRSKSPDQTGFPDHRIIGSPNRRIIWAPNHGSLDQWINGSPRITGLPAQWGTKSRITRSPDDWIIRALNHRITGSPDQRIGGSTGHPGSQDHRMT